MLITSVGGDEQEGLVWWKCTSVKCTAGSGDEWQPPSFNCLSVVRCSAALDLHLVLYDDLIVRAIKDVMATSTSEGSCVFYQPRPGCIIVTLVIQTQDVAHGCLCGSQQTEAPLVVEKMADSCSKISPSSVRVLSIYIPKRFEEDREHKKLYDLKCSPRSSTGRRISSTGRKNIKAKKIRNIVSSTEGGSSRKVGKSTNTVISNLPT